MIDRQPTEYPAEVEPEPSNVIYLKPHDQHGFEYYMDSEPLLSIETVTSIVDTVKQYVAPCEGEKDPYVFSRLKTLSNPFGYEAYLVEYGLFNKTNPHANKYYKDKMSTKVVSISIQSRESDNEGERFEVIRDEDGAYVLSKHMEVVDDVDDRTIIETDEGFCRPVGETTAKLLLSFLESLQDSR